MTSVCYPYDDELVIEEKFRIANMNMSTCMDHAVLADQLEYELPKQGNRVKVISFALKRYVNKTSLPYVVLTFWIIILFIPKQI